MIQKANKKKPKRDRDTKGQLREQRRKMQKRETKTERTKGGNSGRRETGEPGALEEKDSSWSAAPPTQGP